MSISAFSHRGRSLDPFRDDCVPIYLFASHSITDRTSCSNTAPCRFSTHQQLFNLTAAAPDFGTSGIGIWNGTCFLYTTSLSHSLFSGWWDAISAVFRYGPLSPYRTNSAVSGLLKKFALLYNPKFLSEAGAAGTVQEMVERVGLGREMTMRKGQEWALEEVGVGDRWMGEIMEGSTRTNVSL
jgi:prenylcysteine oxidase / farnesylcysteine lyase